MDASVVGPAMGISMLVIAVATGAAIATVVVAAGGDDGAAAGAALGASGDMRSASAAMVAFSSSSSRNFILAPNRLFIAFAACVRARESNPSSTSGTMGSRLSASNPDRSANN